MAQQTDDWNKKWAAIVAQAWADDDFKKRLLTDSAKVLKEHGLPTPVGVRFKVVEDTDQVIHLSLPQKPYSDELAEEQLTRIGAGVAYIVKRD